ncbi:AMP-binding protein [Streptomyces bobili]|uniref:AMP-binding protein n=1 Tax=Streptomyces bobili TaxID=67280 RepID=UPI003808BC68
MTERSGVFAGDGRPVCSMCPSLRHQGGEFDVVARPSRDCPFDPATGYRFTADGVPVCVHPERVGLPAAPYASDGLPLPWETPPPAVAVAGGSALPAEIHRQFEDRFGVTILEGYGLSETSPVASFSRFGQAPRVGSIGVPIPGVEMKLIRDDWSEVTGGPDEIGEIAIKGHNVMKGYYKRPEATAEAIREDWFRSGDLARKDGDGFYYIVDRSKDMIIRGGFNVYPREIEEVLMEHPAVSLVAVIGLPHDSHGEEIKAVVVKKAGNATTEAELAAWAKERLAAYKYPRIVEFVDALPMTSTGKILKRDLA